MAGMGEHKYIRCHDCMAYADVGKFHPSRETSWNDDRIVDLAAFVHAHKGCNIQLVGEYSQDEAHTETTLSDGWEKAEGPE